MRTQLSTKHFPVPIGILCSGLSLKLPKEIYGPESARPLLNDHVLKRSRKLKDIYIALGSIASLNITHKSETGSIISY